MNTRVSGLMTRLKAAESQDLVKVDATQGGQDYGKVAPKRGRDWGDVGAPLSPHRRTEAGGLLKNVEIASSVTTLVTTPTAPLVAKQEVASQVATELAPAPNDHDRRMAALWRHPCGSCTLRRAPGAAKPGYCIGRDDLPLAYGLLHVLPADLGDSCAQYDPKDRTCQNLTLKRRGKHD